MRDRTRPAQVAPGALTVKVTFTRSPEVLYLTHPSIPDSLLEFNSNSVGQSLPSKS